MDDIEYGSILAAPAEAGTGSVLLVIKHDAQGTVAIDIANPTENEPHTLFGGPDNYGLTCLIHTAGHKGGKLAEIAPEISRKTAMGILVPVDGCQILEVLSTVRNDMMLRQILAAKNVPELAEDMGPVLVVYGRHDFAPGALQRQIDDGKWAVSGERLDTLAWAPTEWRWNAANASARKKDVPPPAPKNDVKPLGKHFRL